MDINEFYKANHLNGVGYRPGFAGLRKQSTLAGGRDLGQGLKGYMADPGAGSGYVIPALERIVLLEDMVGSGTQCIEAVEWAVQELGKPVLFVPLILCPNGLAALQQLETKLAGTLTVRPVVELRRHDLLGPERQSDPGWPIAIDLEALADKSAVQLSIGPEWTYGYKNTGCSIATFSNTPDNTLPIVWLHRPSAWEPLFPRVHRGLE